MSEIPSVSPLLDGMKVLEQFSDRGRTKCYYLADSETGEQFVLKHISIPESDTKTEALILTGAVADAEGANEYYEGLAEDLRGELIRLQSFHEHGGVAAWTDFQIVPREGVGFDVYMLMPRKTSLQAHLREKAVSHLEALNIGIDLCDALCTLRESGYTFQNLKPENIFVDSKNHYTIGDLGLMPIKDLQYSAVPEHYLNSFSAPELSGLIPEPNETSDVYSLGMILSYIFNGNHLPFEDEKTSPEQAAAKRLEAKTLPSPVYADYELAEILSVACSPDPKERYASPAELRQALTLYMQRNEISDQLLVPPLSTEAPPEEETPADAPVEQTEEPPENPEEPEALPEPAPDDEKEPEADPQEAEAPETQPTETPEEAVAESAETEPDAEQTAPETPDGAEPAPEDAEEAPETIDELLASVNDVLGDEEPEPEAPNLEANEEAVKETPVVKKKRIWIPLLIGLLALALIGAALYYFYSNWYLVSMDGIEVTDRTADSITVAYNLSSPDPDLTWDCIDTFGNSYSGVGTENRVVFRSLEPGTQYTIRFFPGKLHKLIGETTATAATAALTQIVTMSAAQGPDKTTAQIALVVSGPEPEQWLLTYSSTGSDSGSMTFSGHSAEIPGLKLHETYTFELQAPENVYLSGETSCALTVIGDVQAADLKVTSATEDSMTVTWESLGDAPLSWSVQCIGPGYDETQEVTECAATFKGIRLNQSYTFSLTAEGMAAPLSLTLPANARVVTALEAEALDAGTVRVDWTASDPQPEGGWVVRYQIGSYSGSVDAPEENTALLSGLPSNAELVITLQPSNGDSVIGSNVRTTQTPVASNFGSHEFLIDDSTLSLYAKPAGQDWTYDDLGDSLEEFDPSAEAAVVLQAPEDFDERITDETAITLVIRSESGAIAAYRTVSSTWNDIWQDGRYLTSIKLPADPGKYQLELYFDNQFVNRRLFTVTGTEENG